MSIKKIFELLAVSEERFENSIYFIPSENALSPLARLPFLLDTYSRYFFNFERQSAKWAFNGGRESGEIQEDILIPLLNELCKSRFANVQPISGLNCMTAALAALTEPGDAIFSFAPEMGGHGSTKFVATKMGRIVEFLPMSDPFTMNWEDFQSRLKKIKPALIYIDQANILFPFDPSPLKQMLRDHSPSTYIHFDSSHLNGLILGEAIFNPLEQGADSFGGSTHKTLPGPHKGFFATNNEELFNKFEKAAENFISHSHMAETISLAITLIEMKECNGKLYARKTIENAKQLGRYLHQKGIGVAASERDFTGCHQLWIVPDESVDVWAQAEKLYASGIMLNCFSALPGIPKPAFRLSLAELTRFGVSSEDIADLGNLLIDGLDQSIPAPEVKNKVAEFRKKFVDPKYCYQLKDYLNHAKILSPLWR